MLGADSSSCISPSATAADRVDQSARITALDESQRAWLRRRLHDELAQCLSFALFRLDGAREGPPAERDQVLLQARQLVRQSLQIARDTLQEVDDATDSGALHVGLRHAALEVMVLSGCRIDVHCPPIAQPVPVSVASTLIRAVRELLVNACKHASGAKIRLRAMGREGRGLTLWVRDDGPGIDLSRHDDARGHYGLRRLPDELAAAGVELTVRSMPGHGLSARLRWRPPALPERTGGHCSPRTGEAPA